ncbi:EamA family transporter [Bdellovibrio sp. KM01]|uniref:EamA family transporter n=1 Tax=Bdellovibrio sp. KM01 TaxID=2748865 RepID=UPI0015EA075C|nr:EamA family transporter [Bdellovibrio sp. KM01]QLY26946.1 EamA family transporter [Bdellovibrio sp. KM01]
MNNWLIYAIGSAVFAALTAILGKIGVEGVNSNLATFIRTIVILLVAAALISFRGEWQRADSISTKTYVFLILSGIATGLSWLCYYRALQLGPASKVAPIDKLSVVFVIILALIFLGEKLTLKTAVGAGMIAIGSLVLAF